ncbi:MAG: hypothetical protein KJ949_03295 [Nanoarchaeota archaeon]|nr:hypothetical protein [Nanoarchaeota archaeon]
MRILERKKGFNFNKPYSKNARNYFELMSKIVMLSAEKSNTLENDEKAWRKYLDISIDPHPEISYPLI